MVGLIVKRRKSEAFADYLKRAAQNAEIDLQKLGRMAGISSKTMSQILYAGQIPSVPSARRLDDALYERGILTDLEMEAAMEHKSIAISNLSTLERNILCRIALGRLTWKELQAFWDAQPSAIQDIVSRKRKTA